MQNEGGYIYERGEYRLGWDQKRDGTRRSPHLTIFFYDARAKRVRSRSTGTDDVGVASALLDRLYVANRGGECAFCAACGQRVARAADYLLLNAMTDYYDELGMLRSSADSIRARLKHVREFLTQSEWRLTTCADVDERFAHAFREWSLSKPVEFRNGAGTVTKSKKRAPSTTEESLLQLRAALHHAKRKRRIEEVPHYATKGRKTVSAEITTRVDVETIAAMLSYASTAPRAEALHRFIVVTVCTLARPDAVFDLSVSPNREQWSSRDHLLKLNPQGRSQTRKRRPIVAIPAPLRALLELTASEAKAGGWVVHYRGLPVHDVDSSWSTMLNALGLPQERAYRSYLLRRSVATILRSWHQRPGCSPVVPWDLQGQMGHRERTSTEMYALASPGHLDSVQVALREMVQEIERIAPGCFERRSK